MKAALVFLTTALACFSQTPKPAETRGACSPANTGSNNTFNITCQGISKQQQKELLDIINKLTTDQLPAKDVLAALDDIKRRLDSLNQFPIIQHSEGPNSPNTVNINQHPPARHIPPDKLDEITKILAGHPAKIRISAIQDNPEAYEFAEDWFGVLKAARWEILDDMIRVFSWVGKPRLGLVVKVHGSPFALGEKIEPPPKDTALSALVDSFGKAKIRMVVEERYMDMPENQIDLMVHQQPVN
jgi:hypothetical protein